MKLRHEIKYGEWLIINDDSFKSVYAYSHKGYDGATDANDTRCGLAWSVDQAIEEINDIEAEHETPAMLKEQAQ